MGNLEIEATARWGEAMIFLKAREIQCFIEIIMAAAMYGGGDAGIKAPKGSSVRAKLRP